MKAHRWIVTGRVQGVGFRWFVWRQAERLGLAGYARNRLDGSVEVVAQGSAEALAALGRELAKGPMSARVDHVDEVEVPVDDQLPNAFDTR